jgi:hypothetical protein
MWRANFARQVSGPFYSKRVTVVETFFAFSFGARLAVALSFTDHESPITISSRATGSGEAAALVTRINDLLRLDLIGPKKLPHSDCINGDREGEKRNFGDGDFRWAVTCQQKKHPGK